ncbi:MAG TPA: PrsW family glutamic-type intramembrane protease [Thermodesulfobacteriota bacterium]|nr:PrsW family glutamic-type intramembrane protease [Thermodesulfobacteriota bacterium]
MDQQEIYPVAAPKSYRRVLATGILSFLIGIAILILTGNPVLFPTVVMIGSFTVPVTYVAFFYERRHLSRVNMPTTAVSFLYGGILGVFAASVLEPIFIRDFSFLSLLLVGLIEEFSKIAGLMLIARKGGTRKELDGIILGAASGMGFAALESNGYAFAAFLSSGGSLSAIVGLTLLRGFLSPVGHGTWTAILAGTLFRESDERGFRLTRRVVGVYLLVSLLHGLWDGLPVLMTALLIPGLDILIAQAAVGAVGVWILWRRWKESIREWRS